MCARKGSIGSIVFYVLVITFCWQTPARAASTPPPIGDIVGTYAVTDKEGWYYFDQGSCGQCHAFPTKENYSLTWRITQTSATTVNVYIVEWDWLFAASYSNGFLVQSHQDGAGGFAMGIATFSGTRPKVKFKGDFGWGQYNYALDPHAPDYYAWDPYSGKMTSTDSGATLGATLASRCHEQTTFVPGEGAIPLAAAPPLGIDDVLGIYSCTLTGTIYHPTAGTKEKAKLSDMLAITKIDDDTLNINLWIGDVQAHYGSGVIMLVDIDGTVLDPDALLGMLLAKGKPGKISLKGKVYSIRGLGTIDDEFEVSTVSCKQSAE